MRTLNHHSASFRPLDCGSAAHFIGVGFAVSGRDAGVFSTEWEPLSGLVYDQIAPISDRLYAVRQGERYGDGVSGSVGSGQYLI